MPEDTLHADLDGAARAARGDAARRLAAPRLRRQPRAAAEGDKVSRLIRDVPAFGKLFYRLLRDPRVSRVDKAILAAVIAYVVSPWDLVPERLAPYLGRVDDLYLLALALDRLLNNAGVDVLLDHWEGDLASLEAAIAALDKAASVLPERVRQLLHQKLG
mgnify:CR=1 FL=1